MSAYAAVVGGVVPQKSLPVWAKLGLLDPSKEVWTRRTHELKGLQPGAIAGAQLFQANPYRWAQEVLLPALQRQGITSPEAMRQQLQYLFPNRTASIMDQLVMQSWKFQRDMGLISQSKNLGQTYQALVKRDPFAAQAALQARWTDVKTQLGLAVLPMLITGTLKLTHALQSLNEAMRAHPRLADAAIKAFGALAVALAGAGGLMFIAGTIQAIGIVAPAAAGGLGLLGAALAAIGAPALVAVAAATAVAVGLGLLAKHWREIWPAMVRVGTAAWSQITLKMGALWKAITDTASDGFTRLRNGFTGFFHGILQWMRDHVPHFMDGPAAPGSGGSPGHPARKPVHPASLVGGEPGRSGVVAPLHVQNVTNVSVPVHLDGRKIADVTARHLSKAVGYQHALGRHDPTASLAAAGAGYET